MPARLRLRATLLLPPPRRPQLHPAKKLLPTTRPQKALSSTSTQTSCASTSGIIREEPSKFVFKGSRPAILDFYADWCGPCRKLSPKLEAIAKKYAGKIDVYKIDIDKEAGLADIFGVKSIPMCLFIPMQGTPIQTVGDLTPDQIEETIKQIYSDAK